MSTDSAADNIKTSDAKNDFNFAIKNRGAIFCQHAIIIPFLNVNPLRTSGNQKWHGASPNFMIRAREIIECVISLLVSAIFHLPTSHRFRVAPLRSKAALKACTKKYLRVASFPRDHVFNLSMGRRDSVLISSPNHIGNQCLERMTVAVPSNKVDIRNNITVRLIGTKRILTFTV